VKIIGEVAKNNAKIFLEINRVRFGILVISRLAYQERHSISI
jgi:hypothetical protein